jgi:hypothetical protein
METPDRIDQLDLELREQKAIYRIAISQDGKHLADRLNAMLDVYVGESIETDNLERTMILKGQCRGIRDVIAIFAEIEESIEQTEQEIQVERTGQEF